MLSMNYKFDEADFVSHFKHADVKETGLWVRWLWPDTVEPEILDRELKALADAGIAGAEVGLHAMAATWGTDRYFQSLIWAMRSAKKYGLKLDFFLTVGTLCLPLKDLAVDSDAAEKILYYYDSPVTVGEDGQVSVRLGMPKRSTSTINARLVGVAYAAVESRQEGRCRLSAANAGMLYADDLHVDAYAPASQLSLCQLLGTDDAGLAAWGYDAATRKFDMALLEQHPEAMDITVTLPSAGEYVIFAYWEIPSDKTFGGTTQYCIDHYSLLGTKAVTDVYDDAVARMPELGQLFKEVGRAFFGDSLENNGNWTLHIRDKYYDNFHKDITPYLYNVARAPWSVRPEMPMPEPGAREEAPAKKGSPVPAAAPMGPGLGPDFGPGMFGRAENDPNNVVYEAENSEAIKNSYYQAMTQCFIQNHILAFQEWADKYDMDIRYQSTYGQKQYMAQVSPYIDMAETESLAYRDRVDGYRGQAGSVHMRRGGSGILSSEQGENAENQFHTTTWSGDYLWRSNRFYVAGGNQLVYHVFAYSKYDPPMTHFNSNMVWPGFRPQPNVGDNLQWNRPTMKYMDDYSEYIARTQYMLRTGEARLDAAIYYHSYNNDQWDFDQFYHDDSLEKTGYSYEFIDPSFFEFENAQVEEGVFAQDGPGYRAFLFNNQQDLPLKAAEKLLEYAKQGLAMVFAGELPCRDSYEPENDAQVATIVTQLMKQRTVAHVADFTQWPEALKKLGVEASLAPNGADIMYACRKAKDADYYFLYNQKKYFDSSTMWLPLPDIKGKIKLKTLKKGRKPYILNLWSGDITAVEDYKEKNGYIELNVELPGNATLAIALADDSWCHGESFKVRKIVKSPAMVINNWSLKVISHEPGPKALSGEDLTDTALVALDLGEIGVSNAWSDIPDMPMGKKGSEVSGVGIYTAKVNFDTSAYDGAYLDLGSVCDLYRLTVNGKTVAGTDPVVPVQDIGGLLKNGENEIVVEVASNFYHAEDSRNYLNCNHTTKLPYTADKFGILGKAALIPYKEA